MQVDELENHKALLTQRLTTLEEGSTVYKYYATQIAKNQSEINIAKSTDLTDASAWKYDGTDRDSGKNVYINTVTGNETLSDVMPPSPKKEVVAPTVQQTKPNIATPSKSILASESLDKLTTEATADYTKVVEGIELTDSGNALETITGEEVASAPARRAPDNITVDATLPEQLTTNELKVTLTPKAPATSDDVPAQIVLTVMPTLREGRSATYDNQMTPIHHPGDILKYKGTSARSWGITAKLISRTIDEARVNVQYINLIRSWVMPFHGEGTARTYSAELGAPPPIVILAAYGPQAVGPVPCVVESYNLEWPNDCDFAPDGYNNVIPTIMSVTLELKEAYSPAEYSGFDLLEYRKGNLGSAFNRSIVPANGKNGAPMSVADENAKLLARNPAPQSVTLPSGGN